MIILSGTKVQVLASNGKKRGPNVGSIGYVSGVLSSGGLIYPAFKHMRSYMERVSHKASILNLNRRVAESGTVRIVFTRFGYKGRPRIVAKTLMCVVPMVPLTTKRTMKMFLKGVTTIQAPSKSVVAIAPIKEDYTSIETLDMVDLVAQIYSYVLYLNSNRTFSSVYNISGQQVRPYTHNKTIVDCVDLSNLPLTKVCCALLRQIAINKYNNPAYKEALLHDNFVPAIIALKRVVAHFERTNLDQGIRAMNHSFPVIASAYALQYLPQSVIAQIFEKKLAAGVPRSMLHEVFDNIIKMRKLYWSLSTDNRCKTTPKTN